MGYVDRNNREIHAGMFLRCVANGGVVKVFAQAGDLGFFEKTGDSDRFFSLLSFVPATPELSENRLGLFEIFSLDESR